VRWRNRPEPGKPLAIAGLWRAWAEPEGTAFSFTTLTINSDEHPLMRRFHKPGAEKRSVVILGPSNMTTGSVAARRMRLARS